MASAIPTHGELFFRRSKIPLLATFQLDDLHIRLHPISVGWAESVSGCHLETVAADNHGGHVDPDLVSVLIAGTLTHFLWVGGGLRELAILEDLVNPAFVEHNSFVPRPVELSQGGQHTIWACSAPNLQSVPLAENAHTFHGFPCPGRAPQAKNLPSSHHAVIVWEEIFHPFVNGGMTSESILMFKQESLYR